MQSIYFATHVSTFSDNSDGKERSLKYFWTEWDLEEICFCQTMCSRPLVIAYWCQVNIFLLFSLLINSTHSKHKPIWVQRSNQGARFWSPTLIGHFGTGRILDKWWVNIVVVVVWTFFIKENLCQWFSFCLCFSSGRSIYSTPLTADLRGQTPTVYATISLFSDLMWVHTLGILHQTKSVEENLLGG